MKHTAFLTQGLRMYKILICIAISGLLSACIHHQATPTTQTYNLAIPTHTDTTHNQKSICVRVLPVIINSPYSGQQFVYRESAHQYTEDPYHTFVSAPSNLLTQYVIQALNNDKAIDAIGITNLANSEYLLQLNVTALYADYRDRKHPLAITAVTASLYRKHNHETQHLKTQAIAYQTDVPANDPNRLLMGYQHNLNAIVHQLEDMLVDHKGGNVD